jgi:Creatinine amidohydrolase
MVAAAEKAAQEHAVQVLLLPAMPFGPTPEHRHFGSGCIDLPLALHHALTEAILNSLVAQGFGRMILWRGCVVMIWQRWWIGSIRCIRGRHSPFYPLPLSTRFGVVWRTLRFREGTLIALPPPFRSTSGQNQSDKTRSGTHIPPPLTGLIPTWILLAPLRRASSAIRRRPVQH